MPMIDILRFTDSLFDSQLRCKHTQGSMHQGMEIVAAVKRLVWLHINSPEAYFWLGVDPVEVGNAGWLSYNRVDTAVSRV